MRAMPLGVVRHIAGTTLTAVRCAGLPATVRLIASTVRDAAFDRRYGTDTAGYADPRQYAAGDPRAQRATYYVPTRAKPFLDFLGHARLPVAGTFVDLGCGKGRAMLIAAQYGFRHVTGIELSPALCAAAEANIARFRAHVPDAHFTVQCGDAGEYAVQPDDAVFYFYDPFDDALITRCLANIRASLHAAPRPIAVVYHNSLLADATPFDAADFLVPCPQPRFDGNAFYLYRGMPSGVPAPPGPRHAPAA